MTLYSKTEILNVVAEIIEEHIGASSYDVNMSSSLANDFGADESDFSDILTSVEEEFGIRIPDNGDDMTRFDTVLNIVNLIFSERGLKIPEKPVIPNFEL